MQIEDLFLDIESAIPLGLIINELVSNSFKHAFPDNRKGELQVSLGKSELEKDEYDYTLIVRDNGEGYPDHLNFRDSGGLGMLLVHTLVKQLHGVIDLDRKNGTTFTIKFKKLKEKKRI
jgi:two-component sensor histidine kinase